MRYRLRTLLIVLAVLSVGIVLAKSLLIDSDRIGRRISQLGGYAFYASERQPQGSFAPREEQVSLLHRIIYMRDRQIVAVSFGESSTLSDREFGVLCDELTQLPEFDRISLINVRLTDRTVPHFAKLKNVRNVYIFHTRQTAISAEGLQRIRQLCPQLVEHPQKAP